LADEVPLPRAFVGHPAHYFVSAAIAPALGLFVFR
jgi:hypothetical protein